MRIFQISPAWQESEFYTPSGIRTDITLKFSYAPNKIAARISQGNDGYYFEIFSPLDNNHKTAIFKSDFFKSLDTAKLELKYVCIDFFGPSSFPVNPQVNG